MSKHYFQDVHTGSVFVTGSPQHWGGKDYMKLSPKQGVALMRENALRYLRDTLKPGDTVLTVLRHVASSGMSRRLDAYVIRSNELVYLSGLIEALGSYSRHKDGGLVVHGCGTDAGFSVVYDLGATIWPHGTPEPHGRRNGEPDSSGGYALKHEWL